ncbi:hypothetical protein GCM10009122_34160 [Fulvivirga kasyanovii]|uniref:Uncharacterized protein n=1 Tax=Fulvivirga kasyanovii TaxID=396812 RepID=A0ABW9RT64_9BACT|nr:hypothetical protein [Fulvivirga kasyanovii]MTI27367.1 hypothetical protein [Fulvivirga kasyanovii]
MDSTAELILQGHFSKLRDAINQQAEAEKHEGEVLTLLKQTFNYFDDRERNGALDTEGHKLHQQLAELLDKIHDNEAMDIPGKLPMQKAKPGRKAGEQRKTGS